MIMIGLVHTTSSQNGIFASHQDNMRMTDLYRTSHIMNNYNMKRESIIFSFFHPVKIELTFFKKRSADKYFLFKIDFFFFVCKPRVSAVFGGNG